MSGFYDSTSYVDPVSEPFYGERVEFCPQNVADFAGWTDVNANQNQYKNFRLDNRKVLLETLAPDVFLYSLPTKYFVLDESRGRLLYLVELKREAFKSQSTVRQLKVWRDKSALVTKGLAERVFFDYLLPSTDLVISDGEHTSAGKAFWELRVAEAFHRGLPVFLIDMNGRRSLQTKTQDDYDALVHEYYGNPDTYQAKRLAVARDKA